MKIKKLNVVIPLAGTGISFAKKGYQLPKPLIEVDGKPMIQAVIENLKLKTEARYIFICLKETVEKYSLEKIFTKTLGQKFELIELNFPPQGAACTLLTAIDHINNDDELIIANSDQIIDGM